MLATNDIGRRAFLKNGTLFLAAVGIDLLPTRSLLADDAFAKSGVKVGLITDLHYADKPATGTRYYRETLDKLAEAAKEFEKDKPDFILELRCPAKQLLVDCSVNRPASLFHRPRLSHDVPDLVGGVVDTLPDFLASSFATGHCECDQGKNKHRSNKQ